MSHASPAPDSAGPSADGWLRPGSSGSTQRGAVFGGVPGLDDVDPLPDHPSVAEIQDSHDRVRITAVEPERELDDLHRGGPRRTVHVEHSRPAGVRLARRDDVRLAADAFAALRVFEDRVVGVDVGGPGLVLADRLEVTRDRFSHPVSQPGILPAPIKPLAPPR